MKFLISVTYYHPHWTGLTRYAISLAECLAELGHGVTVITCKHESWLRGEEMVNGVRIIRCKPAAKLSRTLISIDLIRRLPGLIKEANVVIGFLPLLEVLILAVLGKVYKKRLYLIHNGDLVLPDGLANRLIEVVFYWSTTMAIWWSQGIVVNTDDYAQESVLLKRWRNKWRVIVPPIKLTTVARTVQKELRKRIGPARYIVGFAGRFVEEKGFDLLLEAMPKISRRMRGVKFVFAGELNVGYEKTHLANLDKIRQNSKRLVILGKLSRQEMMGFYKMIDLLVISSRSDFFPFVQVEALLSGVPVVVTDIPGARWLVKHTSAGIIVKPNDPESIARGIQEALVRLSELRLNTKKAKDIFNYPRLMTEYETLFSN